MKIVVIGGVATGMSAAMRAKRIDPSADVSVYDAGLYVSFSNCGMPYYFGDVCEREDLISRPPEYFEAKGIRVHTGARVSAIDRREKTITVERIPGGFWGDDADATDAATSVVSYDKLVYAPGAAAITPPIPGSELGHPLRVIEDMDAIERALVEAEQRILEHATDTDEHQRSTHSGQQPKPVAAIIGAGPVGIEIAENLIHRGFAVHVISRPAHVLKPLAGDLAQRVEEELTAHGVQLYLGDAAAKIIEITDEQAPNRYEVTTASGTAIPCDVVITATGVRPRSQIAAAAGLELADDASVLVDEMQRTSDPDVYSGGDVASALMISGARRSTMLAGPANKQGRRIADAIFADAIERGESTVKPPRVIPAKPALGTTIVGCFDVIAGFTGIQEAELLQLGIEYEAVRIDSDSNAGYYPGSQPLSIVGYVRINDGVLLGASVVGGKGADKRLDVLATAITAGMNANDLAELELAYAPQFSHSKDAVNLLGYVASKRVG